MESVYHRPCFCFHRWLVCPSFSPIPSFVPLVFLGSVTDYSRFSGFCLQLPYPGRRTELSPCDLIQRIRCCQQYPDCAMLNSPMTCRMPVLHFGQRMGLSVVTVVCGPLPFFLIFQGGFVGFTEDIADHAQAFLPTAVG